MTDYEHLFIGIPREDSAAFADLCAFCRLHRAELLAALPWIAAEIAGSDGFAQMLRFVVQLSGARLHVSRDVARFEARVGLALSSDTHGRIVRYAGGGATVDVPSAWGVFLTLRRTAIRSTLATGLPPRIVAQRYGVSERSLRS